MKPKPKKLIEKAMDDHELASDAESANNEPASSGGADLFDALLTSNNESPKKTNGTKSAPSPVKGMDSSDDEDNTHNATDVGNNESGVSEANGNDDTDDPVNQSATAEENGDESIDDANNTASADGDADEDGYEVEKIVAHKYKNGRKMYRVRWQNYSEKDDTWQNEDDLSW